jgi:hypothetical protein
MAMKLWGEIQGREILILLDSGSSNTFVSSAVAATLPGISELCQPLTV